MAQVYLESGESFRILDDSTVYGTMSGSETVLILGTPDVDMDANVERLEFTGNLSDYTFQVSGAAITIFSGGNPVAGFPSLNNDITLAFADGSASLSLNGLNAATLGGQALSTSDGGTSLSPTLNASDLSSVGGYVPPANGGSSSATPQTVNVTAADDGTVFDAGAGEVTFNFAQAGYQYTIDDFAAGDVLNVLDTAALTIVNQDAGDGNIDISVADTSSSTTVEIHLTGVAAATDAAVFNVDSFNTAFGAGSLA